MTKVEEYNRNHEEEHAECSPSQLEANMLCLGRRRMRKQKPSETNPYAEEGTMLHERITQLIEKDYLHISTVDPFEDLDRDQRIAIEDCYEYFENVIADIEKSHKIVSVGLEVPTSLDWAGIEEVSGHADVRIISVPKDEINLLCITRLDVIDWKFGQGIFVSYTNNPQARAYASGSTMSFTALASIPEVYMHICQPRLNNMGAEKMSGLDLATWVVNEAVPKVEATRDPKAPCTPGEKQCKWCVGPTCRVRHEAANELASQVFANYVPGNLSDFVSIDELVPMYEKAQLLDTFIKDIAKELFDHCYNKPNNIPGYKVVEGRSNRAWKDPEEAEKFLMAKADDPDTNFEFEDIYNSKLLTPAQAEKLDKEMKKTDEFKALIHKPPGKLTLASADDPRDAVKNDAETIFANFVGKD